MFRMHCIVCDYDICLLYKEYLKLHGKNEGAGGSVIEEVPRFFLLNGVIQSHYSTDK